MKQECLRAVVLMSGVNLRCADFITVLAIGYDPLKFMVMKFCVEQ
jgi:hypothetical protein